MSTITPDDKLAVYGMFAVAKEHYLKCREFEAGIIRRLKLLDSDAGHISDAIYRDDSLSVEKFEEALKREGFSVADEPTKDHSP